MKEFIIKALDTASWYLTLIMVLIGMWIVVGWIIEMMLTKALHYFNGYKTSI